MTMYPGHLRGDHYVVLHVDKLLPVRHRDDAASMHAGQNASMALNSVGNATTSLLAINDRGSVSQPDLINDAGSEVIFVIASGVDYQAMCCRMNMRMRE